MECVPIQHVEINISKYLSSIDDFKKVGSICVATFCFSRLRAFSTMFSVDQAL